MISYVQWLDENGFHIRDAYDVEKGDFGGPGLMKLFPRQRRILEYTLTPDENGRFPYQTVLYSDIKKTGKSVIASSVGAWYAESAPAGTEIFIIANSQEQGAGRVFRDMLFHFQQRQQQYGKKYCKLGEFRIDFPSGTFIQVLSNSFRSAAGSRHALTLWDELWGSCLTPDVPILRGDLTWTPAGELKVGDRLIAFDEERPDGQKYRNWKGGQVIATGRKILPVRKIRLTNGKEFTATLNHKWIARTKNHHNNQWIETQDLKPGYRLMKVLEPWNVRDDYDAGYIAAALDGEGSLGQKKSGDHRLTFSQRKNVMWDEMGRLYDENDISAYDTGKHLTVAYRNEMGIVVGKSAADMIITKKSQIMRVLGSCRPKRLLEKFDIEKMGRMTAVDYVEVESISDVFDAEVVTLTTDTETYVSDGYCSHNTTEIDRRLWDEMVPIPTVPHSLRFISSYAGFENESELLWELFIKGIGPGEGSEHEHKGHGIKIPELDDLPCWENGRLFTYWSHESDLPWYTEEYLDEQRGTNRPAAFLRLFENQWVTSHEAFIPIEWWDKAAEAYEGPADIWDSHPMRFFPITIAVDAGIRRDSTALVAVAYDSKRGKIGILFHRIWKPSPGDPVDIDATVETEIRRLYNEHKFMISSVVYDPTHLIATMERLSKEGIPTRPFDQTSSNMIAASQLLFEQMKGRRLEAYADPDLRRHIQMAVAETSARGFRIVKTKVSKRHHIDAAISLAMACYDAIINGGVDTSIPLVIESPFSDMSLPIPKDIELPFELRSPNDGF